MEIKLPTEEKIRLSNSQDVHQILVKILKREEGLSFKQEHFWVLGLRKDYLLMVVDLVALGSDKRFLVDPKEVFYLTVHKNAKYVILAHNHPHAATLEPSEADKDLTDQLIHAAELLNLRVIDHLIINQDSFFSFALSGLLSKLERSQKYAVYFIEEEKLLKRGIDIGIKSNALKMRAEGLDLALIAKITGLSMEEIDKLDS